MVHIPIPHLGGDAVSALKVLVVVGQMISLHLAEVDLEDFGVVQVVVRHVVEHVAKEGAGHDGVGLWSSKQTVAQFVERERKGNSERRGHDQTESTSK